jgi:hypothetical protein
VWRIVNAGWRVAMRIEPLRYLESSASDTIVVSNLEHTQWQMFDSQQKAQSL